MLAFLVFLVIHGVLLLRWRVFIKALDLKVSFLNTARYFFFGLFGNLFLPSAVGGDIIKMVGLCRKNPQQKPKVFASIILDRLAGYASIVTVAVVAFLFGHAMIGEDSLIVVIGLMAGVSCVAVLVLFNEKIYSFFCAVFNVLPRLKKVLMDIHYDIVLLKGQKAEGYKTILMGCFTQSLLAFSYFLVAKAMHQDIPLIYFFVFIPLICIVSAFPSIGGLGVREMGAAYLFSKVGVASGVAVSLSLINFLFLVVIGLLGGGFYVLTLSCGRVQCDQQDAAAVTP